MALLLERHYAKEVILETFINEVFIAQQGNRAIHGFGLASQFFFGKPFAELQPHQYALLVGMLKAPSSYHPVRNPDRARQRRDLVLKVMNNAGILDAGDFEVAQTSPLDTDQQQRSVRSPAYLDVVKRQLLRRHPIEELQREGLRIFTSFDPQVQLALDKAVSTALQHIDNKSAADTTSLQQLQLAAIVTDPNTGDILAIRGGRNKQTGDFNRALDSERPVGSLLKPAIYLAALDDPEQWTLASLLKDAPVSITQANGDVWSPENFSGKYYGDVTVVEALARSLNLATVNIGMSLGLSKVTETLRALGLDKDFLQVPSLLLGATELSAMDMTGMYQSIAADGFSITPTTIRDVLNSENIELEHYPAQLKQRVDPKAVYLLKYAMHETMRLGTGRPAYTQIARSFPVAGKSGTSDNQRDSWFAGFSGDHLAVVWVGYDNNQPTHLTGSTGALRIWSELMKNVATQPVDLSMPAGVVAERIDPSSGRRIVGRCSTAMTLPFIAGSEPRRRTRCRSAQSLDWPVFREN